MGRKTTAEVDDDLDEMRALLDEAERDHKVLSAEAAKIRADARMAVERVSLYEVTRNQVAEANAMTAWKRSSLT